MAELQFAEGGIAEELDFFALIDQLISHGINAGDVKNLEAAGIMTYTELMTQTKENLTKSTKLPEDKLDQIRKAAEKIVHFGYTKGSEALLRALEYAGYLDERVALLMNWAKITQLPEDKADGLKVRALEYAGYIEERGPLLRKNSVILITNEIQAQVLNGGIETFKITGSGDFSSGDTRLECTGPVSTERAGHQLLLFLSGFPTIGDRHFLIGTHVGRSVENNEKFAMKFALNSEVRSFITSLEKKIIIFVDREQLYFNQFAEVEFQDREFAKNMVDYWEKKSQKGQSHFEGITNATAKAGRKEAAFWTSVYNRADEDLLKKALKWDPNPSKFSFVLQNANEWEAVKFLRSQGVWEGTEVRLSKTLTETDEDSIKIEVAGIEGLLAKE